MSLGKSLSRSLRIVLTPLLGNLQGMPLAELIEMSLGSLLGKPLGDKLGSADGVYEGASEGNSEGVVDGNMLSAALGYNNKELLKAVLGVKLGSELCMLLGI